MKKNSTRRLNRMGRRRFYETLSKLGVSATALPFISKESLANLTDDPENEVPRVFSLDHTNHQKVVEKEEPPEREPVTFTISRDEWARIEGRKSAAHRLKQGFDQEPLIRFGVAKPKKHEELIVKAEYITVESVAGNIRKPDVSYNEFKNRIPNRTSATVGGDDYEQRVENIIVDVIDIKLTEQYYYDSAYRPVPAGCAMTRGGCGGGTIGTPAYDHDNSDWGWLTAAHAVNDEKSVEVYQPNCVTVPEIGDSTKLLKRSEGEGDVAFIHEHGVDHKYDIADNSGGYEGWDVMGVIQSDGLYDLMNNQDPIYVQGKKTGRHQTIIESINDDSDPVGVDNYADTEKGDSGGPYFYLDQYDNARMIAIHRGLISDGSRGTAAYWTENELNIDI